MYLSLSFSGLYVQFQFLLLASAVVFSISLQSIISVKSVVTFISQAADNPDHAIRFDHHGVSVAAISTKPLSSIHLFVIGIYAYCPCELSPPSIPEFFLVVFISDGTQSIPADINSSLISANLHHLLSSGQRGNLPWSIWYATNAAATWARSALRATSLALPLALESLGISAAARIPMITITISISINVNHLFVFFLENIEYQKIVKTVFCMLYRYEM